MRFYYYSFKTYKNINNYSIGYRVLCHGQKRTGQSITALPSSACSSSIKTYNKFEGF